MNNSINYTSPGMYGWFMRSWASLPPLQLAFPRLKGHLLLNFFFSCHKCLEFSKLHNSITHTHSVKFAPWKKIPSTAIEQAHGMTQ